MAVRAAVLIAGALALAACGGGPQPPEVSRAGLYPNETPELRELIVEQARLNRVPVDLVQRVVVRESRHVPAARNGPYYGLMQILPQTAATMGYRGRPAGLLDAETNLKYGVKYLRYWLEESSGKIFCLVEAPDRDAATRVHREAHGLVADELHEVIEGS